MARLVVALIAKGAEPTSVIPADAGLTPAQVEWCAKAARTNTSGADFAVAYIPILEPGEAIPAEAPVTVVTTGGSP